MRKRTREERKAKLMAEAKAIIDELMAWEGGVEKPNLSEMEDEILVLRERLGQRMLEAVIEGQEAKQPAQAPVCASCGAAMRYKGQKETGVESRLGGVELERGHYYCARCESGLFPPG